MKFTQLRLAGFKSFVDPTDLRIDPGLTGVIGPNGCGKSNLLEALRWVMGATSAKSLRGDGDHVSSVGASNPNHSLFWSIRCCGHTYLEQQSRLNLTAQ